jgi:ATP/maltotriose-dependent transcriptional regulator MalT
VSRYHLRQTLREAQLRLPPALRWLIREDGPMDEVCPSPADHSLSQRELEVLELIARGNSNQQIAEQLFISLHTVKTHARRIHGKLGVERRTQAVDKARGLGLIT